MLEKVSIASLDLDQFHIIGMDIEAERLHAVHEIIIHQCPSLKFIVIPTKSIEHIDVTNLTDDQVKIIKEQLK